MKAFKKLWRLIFLSATLTVALCACGGDKAGDASNHITIGIPQDLEETLDPHEAMAAGTREILFNIYEGLVKPNSNGELIPAVADDFSVSEDGLTYTFHLRKGVKFHNGKDVTAEDVLYSIGRNADPSSETAYASAFSNVKEYKAEGENIVIVLKQKDNDFLQSMTIGIIPEEVTDIATNPVGTGPYMYVSRSPQENVILKRFKDYWGEKAYIENVTLKICANADSIVMDLLGGSVDFFARITSAQALQLKDGDFNIEEGTMNLVQAMYLNNAVEPFNNEKVRQALCYAVDPKEIIDLAFDGKGTELGSSMFPAFGKYFVAEINDVYDVDLEKAKALLAEAGYADGFTFTIKVPSNYQPHIDTAQVIAEQLKKIGVTAEIKLVEWESWLSDVYIGRDYEATVVGVDASQMTARAMLERFTSESSKNFVNFKSEAYDAAFNNAVSTTDDAKATEYYKECEWILAREAANVYIQDLAEMVAINKKYTGYEFYPIYVLDIAKIKPAK